MKFEEAIKNRRSIYGLGNKVNISDQRIQEIVEQSVMHTPSAFHSQSARTLILIQDQHIKLWQMVKDKLRTIVPEDSFKKTEDKIDSFAAGYGTILYFEDMSIVENLQKTFPLYKDNFSVWSQQANGMVQFVVWTFLEAEGLGASLQHYNPIVDEEIKKEWDIPASWQLVAQMPFGSITVQPEEKTFVPIHERVKVSR